MKMGSARAGNGVQKFDGKESPRADRKTFNAKPGAKATKKKGPAPNGPLVSK